LEGLGRERRVTGAEEVLERSREEIYACKFAFEVRCVEDAEGGVFEKVLLVHRSWARRNIHLQDMPKHRNIVD
jgi:hypothetical protein